MCSRTMLFCLLPVQNYAENTTPEIFSTILGHAVDCDMANTTVQVDKTVLALMSTCRQTHDLTVNNSYRYGAFYLKEISIVSQ